MHQNFERVARSVVRIGEDRAEAGVAVVESPADEFIASRVSVVKIDALVDAAAEDQTGERIADVADARIALCVTDDHGRIRRADLIDTRRFDPRCEERTLRFALNVEHVRSADAIERYQNASRICGRAVAAIVVVAIYAGGRGRMRRGRGWDFRYLRPARKILRTMESQFAVGRERESE